MKVLINGEWKDYAVELKATQPDGGVIVESEELRRKCGLQIHFYIKTMVIIDDEADPDDYTLLDFYDDFEYECIATFKAILSVKEQTAYTMLFDWAVNCL